MTPWTGYVTATAGLNMRSGRSVYEHIVVTLGYGESVTVYEKSGDWYKISYQGREGYVFSEYVSEDEPGDKGDNFDRSVAFVFDAEKGLSLDPDDPGNYTGGAVGKGELKGTKYGISAAAYPHLDIRNLTVEQARELYRKDYWQKSGADKLDWPLCLAHLDFAVNAGLGRAQQALFSAGNDFIKYMAWRIDWYTRTRRWGLYGGSWIRRCAALMNEVSK